MPRFVPQTRQPASTPKGFIAQKRASGTAQYVDPVASIGAATVSAAVVRVRARAASIAGAAAVTGTVGRVLPRTTSPGGVASVAAVVVRIRTRTVSSLGAATVASSVVRIRSRSAFIGGVGTVSTSAVRDRSVVPFVQGAGALEASVARSRSLAASSSGIATVTTASETPPPASSSGASRLRFWEPRNPHFKPYKIERTVELDVSPIRAGATVKATFVTVPPTSIHPDLESDIDAFLRDVLVICEACEV